MFETILLQVLQNIVVPEVASFIKRRYEETGTWPTREELELCVSTLADSIIREGTDFLNRPSEETGEKNV